MFQTKKFHQFIIENQVIGTYEKPVRLASGRDSYWYVNWRKITTDAFLMDRLTDFILEYLKEERLNPETLYGVPEGATKTALIANFKLAKSSHPFASGSHVLSMGRAKEKPHGDPKDRYFIGAPKGRTLILEDVTTSGGSLLKTAEKLQSLGIEILGALTLTDRDAKVEGGSVGDLFKKKGIPFYRMSHALELLPDWVKSASVSKEIKSKIEEEFRAEGVSAITLA